MFVKKVSARIMLKSLLKDKEFN